MPRPRTRKECGRYDSPPKPVASLNGSALTAKARAKAEPRQAEIGREVETLEIAPPSEGQQNGERKSGILLSTIAVEHKQNGGLNCFSISFAVTKENGANARASPLSAPKPIFMVRSML